MIGMIREGFSYVIFEGYIVWLELRMEFVVLGWRVGSCYGLGDYRVGGLRSRFRGVICRLGYVRVWVLF